MSMDGMFMDDKYKGLVNMPSLNMDGWPVDDLVIWIYGNVLPTWSRFIPSGNYSGIMCIYIYNCAGSNYHVSTGVFSKPIGAWY